VRAIVLSSIVALLIKPYRKWPNLIGTGI